MNNKRRARVSEALELLSQAKTILEEVKEEEENCFDNLSEGLQCTERGEKLLENVELIDEVIGYLDEAENLSDL